MYKNKIIRVEYYKTFFHMCCFYFIVCILRSYSIISAAKYLSYNFVSYLIYGFYAEIPILINYEIHILKFIVMAMNKAY